MKLIISLLLIIPSLSWGEILYICNTTEAKTYQNWGDEIFSKPWTSKGSSFLIKKDESSVEVLNSVIPNITKYDLVGYSDRLTWSAEQLSSQLRFVSPYFSYSQLGITGKELWFLLAKCKIAE
jgi:hypothetical protein